jgi:signal peptidase II
MERAGRVFALSFSSLGFHGIEISLKLKGDVPLPIIALLLSAALVAADQVIKMLVMQNLKPVGKITAIHGFLDFFYLENRGAAFGILQNQRWFFIVIIILISAAIIIALFTYHNHEFFSYAASVLIIGGGIGNLIDRIFRGYVIDYISVSFFPPIFNFADCCVTVGTVFLIIHILFFAEKDQNVEKVLRTK